MGHLIFSPGNNLTSTGLFLEPPNSVSKRDPDGGPSTDSEVSPTRCLRGVSKTLGSREVTCKRDIGVRGPWTLSGSQSKIQEDVVAQETERYLLKQSGGGTPHATPVHRLEPRLSLSNSLEYHLHRTSEQKVYLFPFNPFQTSSFYGSKHHQHNYLPQLDLDSSFM